MDGTHRGRAGGDASGLWPRHRRPPGSHTCAAPAAYLDPAGQRAQQGRLPRVHSEVRHGLAQRVAAAVHHDLRVCSSSGRGGVAAAAAARPGGPRGRPRAAALPCTTHAPQAAALVEAGVRLVSAEDQQQGQGKGGEGEEHGRLDCGETSGAGGLCLSCASWTAARGASEGPTPPEGRASRPARLRSALPWMVRQAAGSMPAFSAVSYRHTAVASRKICCCVGEEGQGMGDAAHAQGRPSVQPAQPACPPQHTAPTHQQQRQRDASQDAGAEDARKVAPVTLGAAVRRPRRKRVHDAEAAQPRLLVIVSVAAGLLPRHHHQRCRRSRSRLSPPQPPVSLEAQLVRSTYPERARTAAEGARRGLQSLPRRERDSRRSANGS